MNEFVFYLPIVLAVLGLIVMIFKAQWVRKQAAGDAKMIEISSAIKEGALAFLGAEYRLLSFFVVGASVALYIVSTLVESTHWMIVPAFILGAFFSAFAGNIGMRIATIKFDKMVAEIKQEDGSKKTIKIKRSNINKRQRPNPEERFRE